MRAALSRERAQRANDAFVAAIIAARGGPAAPTIDLAAPDLSARVGRLERATHPRAYTGPFPIRTHRTLAEIDARNVGLDVQGGAK